MLFSCARHCGAGGPIESDGDLDASRDDGRDDSGMHHKILMAHAQANTISTLTHNAGGLEGRGDR